MAARRGILQPQLPKVAFFGVNIAVFRPRRPPQGPPCFAVNTKKLYSLCFDMMVSKRLDNVCKILILGQKTAFSAPKRAILAVRGLKTAHQAVEWAPTRKPKVSRVTLGCGEVMIPLSRIHWSPKIGCYMGVAKKKQIFWPKIIQNWLWWLPESPPCNAVNTNKLPFWSPVIVILIKIL